jgi:hypothetical protein
MYTSKTVERLLASCLRGYLCGKRTSIPNCPQAWSILIIIGLESGTGGFAGVQSDLCGDPAAPAQSESMIDEAF